MDIGQTKRKLKLDWNKLLPEKETDELSPADIVITAGNNTKQPKHQFLDMTSETQDLERMTDKDIDMVIARQTSSLKNIGSKLPDKGQKFRAVIKRLEDEKERRKLMRLEQEAHVCEKPTHSNSSYINGASDGFMILEDGTTKAPQSAFSSHFTECMENREGGPDNAFENDISLLGRCDSRTRRPNGQSSPKRRQTSKNNPNEHPCRMSHHKDRHVVSNDDQKVRTSVTGYSCLNGESLSCHMAKEKNASRISTSKDARHRKEQTVVLVDEEEPSLTETTNEAENVHERSKDTIYYPSRDDPELVEIRNDDMKCLAPDTYLTSTIMNFYIRYLQPSTQSDMERCDYHFFNTYFYEKLKEAVLYKGTDKESFFTKFRRWWKGVNIFQKPYVFIPIHESLHWSLVIICIPDKADESGPIILHLDSLGFHNSRTIFKNVRSYIKQEWEHLREEINPLDVHIAERVWNNLDRRIDERTVGVPQQQNEYDCGLFVLYFMKRFIEEAPERLKMKDLAMFGKKWFEPKEASGLRTIIWNILAEQFLNST